MLSTKQTHETCSVQNGNSVSLRCRVHNCNPFTYTNFPSDSSSEISDEVKDSPSRTTEKFVHLFAVSTVVFLTHALVHTQWLLPYYFAIAAPILLFMRFILYLRLKWIFFMLDFCYFVNVLAYVFIWIPNQGEIFLVFFALSNGPLPWATVIFRNAMVFHDIDKMTSLFIHLVPPFLSFGIRWHSPKMSAFWFREFVPAMPEMSILWLLVVPTACFLIHSAIYFLIMNVIVRPSEDYLSSYNYLGNTPGTAVYKAFTVFGERFRPLMFYVYNWLFCCLTLAPSLIWYNYYQAHCAFLGFTILSLVWNGGNYYIDDFSVKGFVDGDAGSSI